jgi:molecular chaperone HscC
MRKHLVIEGNPGVLSKDEIQQRLRELAKLKIHPRDEAVNSALVARTLRIFEENLGDVRQAVGAKLDLFLGALNSQRPAEIEQARIELTQLIDSIDSTVQF